MFDSFPGCFNTVNVRIVLCFFQVLFVGLPQVVQRDACRQTVLRSLFVDQSTRLCIAAN